MSSTILTALQVLPMPATLAVQLGLRTEPLKLRRAWPRSAEHLLLEYVSSDGVLTPGQWWASRPAAEHAFGQIDAADGALLPLTPAFGIIGLQVRGADRRLPGLAPLLRSPGAELLVHQPERRAVARLIEQGQTVYAKVVRPERAQAMATLGMLARDLAGAAFATPQLLGVDRSAGIIRWAALAGDALHNLTGTALTTGARSAGQALRALHQAQPPAHLPEHSPAAEADVLTRWVKLAAPFAPTLAAPSARLAETVRDTLLSDCGPYVTLHRDFYDKQILIAEDGRAGLLDFDTLARGEAALDLANALVHFELRALQGHISTALSIKAQRALIMGYDPEPAVQARLSAYAQATRLRLACVYSFRPRWRDCVRTLLARVEAPPVIG